MVRVWFRRTQRAPNSKGVSTRTPMIIPKESSEGSPKKEEAPALVVLPTITTLSQFLDVVKNESALLQTQVDGLDRFKDAAKIKELKTDIETLRRFMFACLALRSSTSKGNSDTFNPKMLQLLRELAQRQGINANLRFTKIQSALDRVNGRSQSFWSEASKTLPLHDALLLAAICAVSTSCPLISVQDSIPSFDCVFPTQLSPMFCGYSNDANDQGDETVYQMTSTKAREVTGVKPDAPNRDVSGAKSDANPADPPESIVRIRDGTVSETQEYREEQEEPRDGANTKACLVAERTPTVNGLMHPNDGNNTNNIPQQGSVVIKDTIVSVTDQMENLVAVWKEQASMHAAVEYGLSCGSNVSLSA